MSLNLAESFWKIKQRTEHQKHLPSMGVQEGAPYEVKETQLLILQEASEAVLHPASWHVFLSYFFISPSFIQFWENTKARVQ